MRAAPVVAVAVVVLASFVLSTDAFAAEHKGRTACGPYKLLFEPGRGTAADPGSLSGELCDGKVTLRGTASEIAEITFTSGSARYTVAAQLPAPDPRQRPSIEAFAAKVDRLRLVAELLRGSDDPSLAERLFNAKTKVQEGVHHLRAGASVGCTDVAEIAATMGAGAYLDHEPSLSYRAFWVPPHCTVIVDGTVDVADLRVDGMLIRLGGGIEADVLRGGGGPVGLGRIFATGDVTTQQIRFGSGIKLSATGAVTADTIELSGSTVAAATVARFRTGTLRAGAGLSSDALELDMLDLGGASTASARTFFGQRRGSVGIAGTGGGGARLVVTGGATAASGRLMQLATLEVNGGTARTARYQGPSIVATGGLVRASEKLDGDRIRLTAGGRLSGGHIAVTSVNATSASVNVSILEAAEVKGTDASIVVRQHMTVRTGAARVAMVRGSLLVSTQALDLDDPATRAHPSADGPVEPEGPPAFDACLATPPGLDATTLDVDGTNVSVRHSKLDTLRARNGSYRPVYLPAPLGVPRATMCLEVSGEGTFDGTFVAASRLYVGLGRGHITTKAELAADEGGDLPRTGSVIINTEDRPLAAGASFGGYGGSAGAVAGNIFTVAEAPVDEPRAFREGGLGGQGANPTFVVNGYAAGFAGAGVIRIVARDLVLDGKVHADGRAYPRGIEGAGGGSGGSIVLALSGALSGKGAITAHGGDGGFAYASGMTGGGGSGGRIRIEHAARTGWRGTVLAHGGLGGRHDPGRAKDARFRPPWSDWRNHGGPGTVYWKPATGPGQIVIEGPPVPRATGGKHRGVGFITGDLGDDEVVIKSAFVVADALRAGRLTIAAGGVLTADEPRLRLEWPPTSDFFSSDYPDEMQAGWGGIDQVQLPAALWKEPLEESLAIVVSGDLTIEKGGRLDLTGLGLYSQAEFRSSDAAANRAGGSHGGRGGVGRFGNTSSIGRAADVTGDQLAPTTPGQGGWGDQDWNRGNRHPIGSLGGAGGGVMRIDVAGTATIDGELAADGAPGAPFFDSYHSQTGTGGGAGGSVWLSASSLRGRGVISADGGAGTASPKAGAFGGGGGGGRVRVDTATATAAWRGQIRALGGAGGFTDAATAKAGREPYGFAAPFRDPRYDGGPGTVFSTVGSAPGTLVIDGTRGGVGTCVLAGPLPADKVARVVLRGAPVMAYTPLAVDALALEKGAMLTSFDRRWWMLYLADPRLPVDALTLGPSPFPTALALTVARDFSIDRTSRLDVTGIGDYGKQACIRACSYTNHAGGSHGGAGGSGTATSARQIGEPSPVRGDASRPLSPGEGGWGVSQLVSAALGYDPCTMGGSGGGALELTVGGTLNLAGTIAADGAGALPRARCPRAHDAAGGGAGGSILVKAQRFAGGGALRARGGGGVATAPGAPKPGVGGGGGGGRITVTATTCAFRGTATVAGGGSEAGTGAAANAFRGADGTVVGGCPR